MILLGLFGYKQTFSLQKLTKLYRTPMKFFLVSKITFFEKWPKVTLLDEFNVEK